MGSPGRNPSFICTCGEAAPVSGGGAPQEHCELSCFATAGQNGARVRFVFAADCLGWTSMLNNLLAFPLNMNPCPDVDCSSNICTCSMAHGDSLTVSANLCPDTITFAVTTVINGCALQETPVQGITLACTGGVLTASGFTTGPSTADMVTALACAC